MIYHVRRPGTRAPKNLVRAQMSADRNPARTTRCGAEPTGYDVLTSDVPGLERRKLTTWTHPEHGAMTMCETCRASAGGR